MDRLCLFDNSIKNLGTVCSTHSTIFVMLRSLHSTGSKFQMSLRIYYPKNGTRREHKEVKQESVPVVMRRVNARQSRTASNLFGEMKIT